jgi:TolB-like protein
MRRALSLALCTAGSLVVVLSACSSAPPAPAASAPQSPAKIEAAETIATAIVAEAPKLQKRTVAVIEFSEAQGPTYVPSSRGRLLAERITTRLVNTGQLEVVERAQLDKVMRELKLGTTGLVDDATAKSIGKLLGVEAIVTGTLAQVGQETEIHSRMVRVEDGVILAAVTTRDVIQLTARPPEPGAREMGAPPRPVPGLQPRPARPEFPRPEPDSIEEGSPHAHYDRLFREGRLAQLNQETRFALDQNSSDFMAHLYQALLQQDSGRPKLAREHLRLAYDGALRLPAPERGIRVIAQTLLRIDRPAMAREVVIRALQARPELRTAPDLQDLLRRLDIR